MEVIGVLFILVLVIHALVSIQQSNTNTHEWRGDKRTQRMLEDYGMLYNPEQRTNPIVWIMLVGIVLFLILMFAAKS